MIVQFEKPYKYQFQSRDYIPTNSAAFEINELIGARRVDDKILFYFKNINAPVDVYVHMLTDEIKTILINEYKINCKERKL
jgi:hypothetical protein